MKSSLLLGVLATLTTLGQAQVSVAPGQAAKVDPVSTTPAKIIPAPVVTDPAAIRAVTDNAATLATGNNLVGAEQALITLNHAKPNTAAWHVETAQRLMQTAEQLARSAHPANIAGLAASALAHLDQADTLTTDPRTRASAKSLAGFIQDRFLANPAAALASYQAAAQLAPTAKNAMEAVGRLQKIVPSAGATLPPGSK